MNKEQIQVVKKLLTQNKLEELKTTLKGWLKEEKLTVDDLITNCKKKTFAIPENILVNIGRSYSQGKDSFTKNTESAFKFYQCAAELGSTSAKGDCAQYYLDGRAIGGKNLDLAFKFCDDAIQGGRDRNYLMGNILYQKQEFQGAVKFLRKVIENGKSSEADKRNARELEKQCLSKQLERLYQKIAACNNAPEEKGEKELKGKKEIQFPGWTNLSEEIDAFDINNCTELTMQVKLIELDTQAAEAALSAVQKNVTMARQEKLPEKIITALTEKEEIFKKNYRELKTKKESILKAYQSYIDITEQVIQRQIETEKRFFNPRRTKKQQTFQLAMELEKRRLSEGIVEPLVFGEQIPPARRTITAERSTIESSVEIFGRASGEYDTKTGWSFNLAARTEKQGYYQIYIQDYAFTETLQIGSSQVKYKHRTNPHYNHLGDYDMEDIGTYNKIIGILNKITGTDEEKVNVENEKKLAEIMLKFSHDGVPVTLASLQSINKNMADDDVHSINRIFYHCFVKEIARWMLPKDKSHELPLAIAQSRALQLIRNGYLTITEVFSQYAIYGVFTGKNIGKDIEALREKVVKINALYDKVILEKRENNFLPYMQCWKKKPSVQILPTRKKLHDELQETFGGESDTDGEGYESDKERERLCSAIKI